MKARFWLAGWLGSMGAGITGLATFDAALTAVAGGASFVLTWIFGPWLLAFLGAEE